MTIQRQDNTETGAEDEGAVAENKEAIPDEASNADSPETQVVAPDQPSAGAGGIVSAESEEPTADVETTPEVAAEAEATTESVAEAAIEPVAEAEATTEPAAEVEVVEEPTAEVEAAPEPVAEAEVVEEPAAEAAPEPVAEAETEPVADAIAEPAVEPVAEAAPEPTAEVAATTEPVAEAEAAAEIDSEPFEEPDQLSLMTEMEKLLEGADAVRNFNRGSVAEGVIMRMDRDGILVHIGAKSEGVIPSREMRSLTPEELEELSVGDEIVAYVLRTDDSGQIILSYDRARGERAWRLLEQHLEDGEVLEAKVIGYNRGGLLVSIEGVQGFVPLSQIAADHRPQGEDTESALAEMMGQALHLKVIEVNRRRQRAILSERVALQAQKDEQKERLVESLQEGEIRQGRVTGLQEFGAFVDLGGADGLIHISELSWEPVNAPGDIVQEGQDVDVYVMKVDQDTRRISLSLRRAQPDPWAEIAGRYVEGQLVQGTVTRLTAFGAFARVEGPIEGLIHISELSDRRIRHPREVVREGDVVSLKVLRIEPDRRRLGLSLRQASEV